MRFCQVDDKDQKISVLIENFCRDVLLLDQHSSSHIKNHVTEKKRIKSSVAKIAKDQGINSETDNLWEFLDPRSNFDLHTLAIEDRKLTRTTVMQFNAYFVYSFSLFEKFLSDVVRLSVTQNKKVRELYAQQFLKFAKEYKSKHNDDRYVDMLTDWKKMLDNYDEMPNPLSLATYIFGIDTENKDFKQHLINYVESRERRNLLIHRGEFFDKRYLDSVKRGLGKNGQQYEKLLKERVFWNKDFDVKKIQQSEISANVSPRYFRNVIHTLLFISNVVHMSAFRKTKKFYLDNGSYSLNPIHRILRHAFDFKVLSFLITCREIWSYMGKEIVKTKIRNWFLFERVNYCLCRQKFIDIVNPIIDKNNEKNGEEKRNLEPVNFELILKECGDNLTIHRNLALAHFRGEPKKLIKYARELKLTKVEFNDWCLFHSWQNDPDLKNFFETSS